MTHPDQSEQQLRRALGTMNDLQPPTDELFVQRAIIRGRARTYRRRNLLAGVAAALLLVAGGGGVWVLQNGRAGSQATTQAGAGPEAQYDTKGGAPNSAVAPSGPNAPSAPSAASIPTERSGVLGARDAGLFVGPMTPERAAFESVLDPLTTTWAGTYSGAWATDASNTQIVVALTHPDPAVEDLVRAAMPSPGDVQFVTAAHSYSAKSALADRILGDSQILSREGITLVSVAQDYRADGVAVAAYGPQVAERLADRYGADWITVTALAEAPNGKLPDGSTVPPLQR